MSVFIQGMDMPLDCSNCDFCRIVGGHYYCNRTKHKISVYYGSRQGDCPIINILTPHGRLIDAEKAAHSILMMSSHPCGCSIENVKDVVKWLKFINGDGNNFAFPTIIEAEVNE